MHPNSMKLMAEFRDYYLSEMKGCTVLDVGSQIVAGQKQSYRDLFAADYKYTGMDVEVGPNVDIVGYDELGIYDVIVSGQCMEHVRNPFAWLNQLWPHFKRYICIIAPAVIHEHRYPIDCWRIYPDGMRALLEECNIIPVEVRLAGNDTIGIGEH